MALCVCLRMIQPSFKEFCRLAKDGNVIPVYQELLMDLETPLSFFKRLERDRYAFLLESVEGSERWARFSFLGTRPYLIFRARGNRVAAYPEWALTRPPVNQRHTFELEFLRAYLT